MHRWDPEVPSEVQHGPQYSDFSSELWYKTSRFMRTCQNTLLIAPASQRCASRLTRDVPITHENPTVSAGASLPTFHLNSSQILPDPFISFAQVSTCWGKKSLQLSFWTFLLLFQSLSEIRYVFLPCANFFYIYFSIKKNNLLMWCWNHIIYVIERAWSEMSGLIIVSGSILCMKSVFTNRPDLSAN